MLSDVCRILGTLVKDNNNQGQYNKYSFHSNETPFNVRLSKHKRHVNSNLSTKILIDSSSTVIHSHIGDKKCGRTCMIHRSKFKLTQRYLIRGGNKKFP